MGRRRGLSGPIRLREYEKLPYEALGEAGVRGLERLTKGLGIPVFRFYRAHAQTQQYVGTVRAGGVTVQILPKVYDRDDQNLGFLLFLLRYTRRLTLRQAGVTAYEKLRGSFLEIWIRHFASELNRLLRTHLKHRYVEVEERVGFLRGKLLVERELAGTGNLTGRYACRYEVFTPDNLLNQTLKFCNGVLLDQAGTSSTRTILEENAARLEEVSDRTVGPEDLGRIHLDRLDREYEPLLGMCLLLLEGSAPSLEAGRIEQLAFVFDMNRLFEEFVAEFLRRHADRIELDGGRRLVKVERQRRLGRLFGEFDMKVDLVLTDDSRESFLVDTKYKLLDPAEQHSGLSQDDFYQMYAYGTAGRRSYADIVLLYPNRGKEAGVRRTFRQDGLALHVRQFDLGKIYEPETGRPDVGATVKELGQALSFCDGGERDVRTPVEAKGGTES